MLEPKWLVVVRNEYRIHTSKIRKIRRFFPFLATGSLLVYPAFSEKAVKFFINIIVPVFVSIGLFAASIAITTVGFGPSDPTSAMLYIELLQTGLAWLVGTGLLVLGRRKLSKIE